MQAIEVRNAVSKIGINLDAVINIITTDSAASGGVTRQDIATVLSLVRAHVCTNMNQS